MTPKRLAATFSVSAQLDEADVARAAALGYRAIIDNRPDGEERHQPCAAEIAAAAKHQGLGFAHVPVVSGKIGDDDVAAMADALARLETPVLAYCRTGTRSATLWALTRADKDDPDAIIDAASRAGYDLGNLRARLAPPSRTEKRAIAPRVYDVVIVGGGAAGIATAASLLKRRRSLEIAVVDPARDHHYQPGWTMVGAGVFSADSTRRSMASVMPDRVDWIRQAVAEFAPDADEVILADGSTLRYRALVAAPGIALAWDAITGLVDALGQGGVTSNYRHDLAPYTRDLVRGLQRGRALFTQPPMPIKCAGAPQKAMYLSCDHWRVRGVLARIDVEFHLPGAVLFGVPHYVPALMEYVERYGVGLNFGSKLVAVDGPRRTATFEVARADGAPERVERDFTMLHAVPPQVAPTFVARSSLAGADGFVAVDPGTLRHVRYRNVFSLGDACSAPNAKTAAAVRKQAPVVAVNVLAALAGREPIAVYDGYGSCPLTVERGRIVLAEFGYGGKLLPSFPKWLLDGARATRAAWFLKDRLLPPLYWNAMLKGREWMAAPRLASA